MSFSRIADFGWIGKYRTSMNHLRTMNVHARSRFRDGPCVTAGLEFLNAGHCITSRAKTERLDEAGAAMHHDAGEALPSLVEGDELSSGLVVQGY